MRIGVIGSGGIGGYYGALLAKVAHDVVFVARGSHLEAMERHGLMLRTPAGETTVPVTAVADPGGWGRSISSSSASRPTTRRLRPRCCARSWGGIRRSSPSRTGWTTPTRSASRSDPTPCFRARSTSRSSSSAPASCSAPAVRDGWSSVSSTVSERIRRIAAAFQQSGIPHEVSPDIQRLLWEKFLFNTGVGGVTALARSGIVPLLASPEGWALLTASCDEIVGVAAAAGAPLTPAAARAAIEQAGTVPPHWRSSMARDLEDGRQLEVDALSGAVVRRGRTHAVPTPIRQAILVCLSLHQPKAP